MIFNGTEFFGVDDTATDEGAPVDTALVHYLVNGIRFMQHGRDRAGLPLLCRVTDYEAFDSDAKVVTGANLMGWFVVPMTFDGAPSRLRIDVLQNIDDFFNEADPLIEISAILENDDGSAQVEERLLIDDFSDRSQRFSLDLRGEGFSGSATLYLQVEAKEVEIKDQDGFRIVNRSMSSISVRDEPPVETAPDYDEGDPSGPQPASEGAEHPAVTSTSTFNEDRGTDHLVFLGDEIFQKNMAIHFNEQISSLDEGALFRLPWLNIGALHIEVDYRTRLFEDEALRSNIVEKTEIYQGIEDAQERIFKAPKLVSIGNIGSYGASDDQWPVQHRIQWTSAGPDVETPYTVISQSIPWQPQVAEIEIRMILLGLDANLSGFPGNPQPENMISGFERNRAITRWSADVQINQWRDGSIVNVATADAGNFILTCYPVAAHRNFPMMTQAYHRLFADDGDGQRYTYREGQFSQWDKKLFQTLVLNASIPSNVVDELAQLGDPFEIGVDLELRDETVKVWSNRRGWAEVSRTDSEIQMFVAGHSIYTRRSR